MFEIPDVDYTVDKIHDSFDSKDFLKDLYENIIISKGEEELYNYFSKVYDDLFSDLLLRHTYISNDTKKMLEILATPIYKKSESERNEIYEKLDNM